MCGTPGNPLEALTGPAIRSLLEELASARRWRVRAVSVRQVDHRPHGISWASFRVTVTCDGVEMSVTAGAAAALTDELPRWPVQESLPVRRSFPGVDASAWWFPFDPMLPGLAAIDFPARLDRLLASADAELGGPAQTTLRAYRAGKRAVVHVQTASGGCYLKALRPPTAAAVQRRHLILHGAGLPVPSCYNSAETGETGVLVLRELTGQPMRAELLAQHAVPDGQTLLNLVLSLPAALCALPRRRSWSDGARHYAAVIGAALPEQAERTAQLAEAVLTRVHGYDDDEPCHGDLYEAQLLISGSQITGLLDIDSAGPGRRADDIACLVAHTQVLALIYADRASYLKAIAAQWLSAAETVLDPVELRARIAGVLLSLATGPHRVQETRWRQNTLRRLDEVERWL